LAALPERVARPAAAPPAVEPEPPPRRGAVWRRFSRHRLALVALGVLAALYLLAILAPVVTGGLDPNQLDLLNKLAPPGAGHLLGTDEYGRDLWARIAYGARISLSVGLVAVAIQMTVGVLVGATAGYYGGWVDALLMRFTDAVLSFPFIFLLITIVAVVGPSLFNIFAVIGLTSWPVIARLVRGEFLSLRERDYVEAARALGALPRRVIFRHLLPNAVAPLVVAGTLGVASAILAEAGLDFIGVGLQPPTSSWGTLLNASQNYLLSGDWWYAVFPGAFIVLSVLCINLIGDALQEAFNPKATHRR
jgi:peptide/nickel transport system permease protein